MQYLDYLIASFLDFSISFQVAIDPIPLNAQAIPMRLDRLRGRKNCDRLQRVGTLWKGKNFFVRFVYGPLRHPGANPDRTALYVGVLTSSKLSSSAVTRNRMRRRCREALRLAVLPLEKLPTAQLLILPRSSSLTVPFADIQNDARTFLTHLTHGA